jgi:hypothetical protein
MQVVGQDLLPINDFSIEHLKFNSERERELVENKDDITAKETIELWHEVLAEQDELENTFSVLEAQLPKLRAIKSKNKSKQINKIMGILKDQFFKYEVDDASILSQIRDQEYSCLSGAITIAYYLEELNIPYQINLSEACTYLFAYPEGVNVPMSVSETPYERFEINADYQKLVVDELLEYHYITNIEYYGKPKEELFAMAKLTFENEPLTVYAANVYLHNLTVNSGDDGVTFDHYEIAKKYAYFSNSIVGRNYAISVGFDAIGNQEYDSLPVIDYMEELFYLDENFAVLEDLRYEAQRIFDNHYDENDYDHFDRIIHAFAELSDSSFKREILSRAYDTYAAAWYRKGELDSCFKYRDMSFNLSNRESIDCNAWVSTFLAVYDELGLFEFEELYNHYSKRYPELNEYPHFQLLNQKIVLLKISNLIDTYRYNTAYLMLSDYEDLHEKQYGSLKVGEYYINRTFGRLAIFYFSDNNNKKALEIINRGLAVYPESSDLLRKKAMIN